MFHAPKLSRYVKKAQDRFAHYTEKASGFFKTHQNKIKKVAPLTIGILAIPVIVSAAGGETPQSADPLSTQQQEAATKVYASALDRNIQPKQKVKISLAENPNQKKEEPKIEPAPAQQASQQPRVTRTQRPTSRTVAPRSRVANRNTVSSNRVGSSYEQCVPFARELSGVQIRGYAGNIQPNAYAPKVGAVALTAGYGHAAVVTGVNGDNITIKEANYVPGQITERTIPASSLRGYVY